MCLQVIDSIHEKIAYPLQYGLSKLVPNPEPLFSISEIGLRGLKGFLTTYVRVRKIKQKNFMLFHVVTETNHGLAYARDF